MQCPNRSASQSSSAQFKLTPDIGRALNHIDENLTETLSLDDLAKIALLSASQFKQKFKKQLGITPRHYINLQKINLAKIMLEEQNSVIETASALGFETTSYFSMVFRKFCSCTPSAYRKAAQ